MNPTATRCGSGSPRTPAAGCRENARGPRRPPPRRGLHQPEQPRRAYSGALRGLRHLARWPAARGRDPRRVPRRVARPGPGNGERVAGGGGGVLQGPPGRRAEPGRGTGRPGPHGLPADRRQSGPGASAAVRGRRTSPPSSPPATAAPARPRVRGGRPRARPPRRRDRRAPLHGGDAAEPRAAPPEKDRNLYRQRSSARCSCRVSDRTA